MQLMTMLKNGTAGPSGVNGSVGGEAWQKMENALKDQQEKFTMMQAKMKALDGETRGGLCGWLWLLVVVLMCCFFFYFVFGVQNR